MAIALEVGVFDLGAKFRAHTLVFLGSRKAARTVSAGLLQALFDLCHDGSVFVETNFHSASSSFFSSSFSR